VAFIARARGELVRSAQGGVQRFAGGGVALVGERGPELVGLPDGSQVMPAERLARIAREAQQGTTNNVTVNAGVARTRLELEHLVVGALRNYTRRNGPIVFGRTL
jgi:hypothetical protein